MNNLAKKTLAELHQAVHLASEDRNFAMKQPDLSQPVSDQRSSAASSADDVLLWRHFRLEAMSQIH